REIDLLLAAPDDRNGSMRHMRSPRSQALHVSKNLRMKRTSIRDELFSKPSLLNSLPLLADDAPIALPRLPATTLRMSRSPNAKQSNSHSLRCPLSSSG